MLGAEELKMRAGLRQRPKIIGQKPWRLLAISLVLALLFGFAGLGDPAENALRVARNKANPVAASGDIAVIKIDDASQRAVGTWPWPRTIQAQMIDRLTDAGARNILIDLNFRFRESDKADRTFAQSLARSRGVFLPINLRSGEGEGQVSHRAPDERIASFAQLGLVSLPYDYNGAVWRLPYAMSHNGQTYRSFAAIVAGVDGPSGSMFPLNYRIALDSIPQYSASELLSGKLADRLRGKTVIVGTTSENIGETFLIPGRGRRGGVFIHAIGAETLKRGVPTALGWWPMLLMVIPLALCASLLRGTRAQAAVVSLALALTIGLPIMTEARQWFIDVTPAIFFLLCVATGLVARRYRLRGTTNLASGLPNLTALRASGSRRDQPLIVARIVNYTQLAAALPVDGDRALVDQIVQRLTVGAREQAIFQGDEGLFAWFAEPGTAIGHHVEALHSLFRNPARVDGVTYDLNISFGVEVGSGRTITQRLNSALVAADEAAGEGLKWKYHDPERMKDANWRLSLLSQLDRAIENGEMWVAFQPQLDLATGRLRGAEALARWTHPEKGPISPQEFVAAAEQGGRIEKLTMFVLEQGVAAAARFNRQNAPFDVAINLSARMLTMKSLAIEVRAALARHNLDPARLTLELTETAALAGDGSDLAPLHALRELGVKLSIDDYGTGLSTLDYLKKVPASEIKIDQSFIKAMPDHRSDLVMVQSTIALAHSLERSVVAEGVETEELLDLLRSLGCDVAQGFLIGRPTSADGLLRRLKDERRLHVA